MKIFAAFIIVANNGKFAATTRPDNRIGLPGGKLEKGENPFSAAIRESAEEGWAIIGPVEFHHIAEVEGNMVMWISAQKAEKLENYKEKNRGIIPIWASGEILAKNGMGNEFLENYK